MHILCAYTDQKLAQQGKKIARTCSPRSPLLESLPMREKPIGNVLQMCYKCSPNVAPSVCPPICHESDLVARIRGHNLPNWTISHHDRDEWETSWNNLLNSEKKRPDTYHPGTFWWRHLILALARRHGWGSTSPQGRFPPFFTGGCHHCEIATIPTSAFWCAAIHKQKQQ